MSNQDNAAQGIYEAGQNHHLLHLLHRRSSPFASLVTGLRRFGLKPFIDPRPQRWAWQPLTWRPA
jgi:hypothetical protein